jgi:PAS domain S-box-containing protein
VLRTKKPLLLDETQLQDRYATGRNRVWGTAPKCWLGVPLLLREEAIGVMAIQDYYDCCAYGRKDLALLESTAGQVAIAVDRKRTEAALHESVETFRGYFNMGTVGVCVTSPEKGWIEVNDYMCRMLGYTRHELLRLTWAEMTHPDDLDADVALFNQVLAGQRDSYELEKRFIRKDGQTIYTLLYATCQRNPDGSVHHFLVSLVDISERKKAESLEQAVYEIARAADQAASLDDLYRSVHRIILTLMPATNILIARYDEKENEVSFPYFVDEKDPMPKSRKSGRGLTDYVLRTGRTLLSDPALEKELERSGEAKRRGSPSACWLGVPLKVGDKAIGVIALDNYTDPHAYGEREKKILEYVSGQIANAIARKQAEEEIKRQLAEKEILLKEVHHRIKNNIASIAGLISLRLQSISNPEAAAVLKDAFGRIDSMRILYDKLLLSEKYQDIPVKNYVESLVDTVMALFPGSAKVTLDKHISDFHLDSKRLFSLGIIINELLTNKMKYAFAGRKRGTIKIDLVHADNHVTLAIADDGNRLPEGFDVQEAKGFGLMLVKMLSQQLGGSFSLASEKGTRCTVAFDI